MGVAFERYKWPIQVAGTDRGHKLESIEWEFILDHNGRDRLRWLAHVLAIVYKHEEARRGASWTFDRAREENWPSMEDRQEAQLRRNSEEVRAFLDFEEGKLTEREYNALPTNARRLIRWRAKDIERQRAAAGKSGPDPLEFARDSAPTVTAQNGNGGEESPEHAGTKNSSILLGLPGVLLLLWGMFYYGGK